VTDKHALAQQKAWLGADGPASLAWALGWQIDLLHIHPGKPTQNAQVECFLGRLREECLRVNQFVNSFDARRKIAAWKRVHNERSEGTPRFVCGAKVRRARTRRCTTRHLVSRLEIPRADHRDISETAA
jgi:hypothetical protein